MLHHFVVCFSFDNHDDSDPTDQSANDVMSNCQNYVEVTGGNIIATRRPSIFP